MSDYAHLTAAERDRIAELKTDGLLLRVIGRTLGRSASTISRELRRNALDSGGYRPHVADGSYLLRRQRAAGSSETDTKLAAYVTDRLAEGWTPEQIAGRLPLGIETGLRAVCTETIYGWIYRTGQKVERLWRVAACAGMPGAGSATDGRLATRSPRRPIFRSDLATLTPARRCHPSGPADVQEARRPEAGGDAGRGRVGAAGRADNAMIKALDPSRIDAGQRRVAGRTTFRIDPARPEEHSADRASLRTSRECNPSASTLSASRFGLIASTTTMTCAPCGRIRR